MPIQDPEVVRQWGEDGYVVLKQVVPHDLIDRLNGDVAAFRASCGETKDEQGYGQRIGLLHIQNQNSLAVALNADVREFLAFALADEPLLFGSLTFEAGTEQGAHQDSIYFWTEPDAAMAGVWVALEDVHEDAGPLFYYRGSHKWGVFRAEDCWRARPDLYEQTKKLGWWKPDNAAERGRVAAELGATWHELMAKRIAERNAQPTPVVIKKGDALVWHAHLVHGGLPRKNRTLTRRSMVTHHIGRSACMFDMNTYFLSKRDAFDAKHALALGVTESPQGPYVQHEKPVTY
jgi:ectoine hydroxylase-related dioxygenase (phytanoyl-CoA dioxygenase family)